MTVGKVRQSFETEMDSFITQSYKGGIFLKGKQRFTLGKHAENIL